MLSSEWHIAQTREIRLWQPFYKLLTRYRLIFNKLWRIIHNTDFDRVSRPEACHSLDDEAEKKDFARGKVIKLSVFCINSWKNTGFFRVNIVVLR